MTMLDEDRLAALFGRAGGDVRGARRPGRTRSWRGRSARRRPRTAAPARRDERRRRRPRRRPGTGDADVAGRTFSPPPGAASRGGGRRHRILSVAACLVVVLLVAGTIGAVVAVLRRGPRRARPCRRTAARRRRAAAVPTTTVPAFPAAGRHRGAGGRRGRVRIGATPTPNSVRAGTAEHGADAPSLPKGAVGQSAKIEQTGTLGLAVGRGDLAGP